MNQDRLQGRWKQWKGRAMREWGKTTNDEIGAARGKYVEVGGWFQEHFGIAKEKAARQMEQFRKRIGQL